MDVVMDVVVTTAWGWVLDAFGMARVKVACPSCGEREAIERGDVASDGTMMRALACGCAEARHLVLAQWPCDSEIRG